MTSNFTPTLKLKTFDRYDISGANLRWEMLVRMLGDNLRQNFDNPDGKFDREIAKKMKWKIPKDRIKELSLTIEKRDEREYFLTIPVRITNGNEIILKYQGKTLCRMVNLRPHDNQTIQSLSERFRKEGIKIEEKV